MGAFQSSTLAAEPLPVTSVSPASGVTIPLPSGPIPFEVVVPVAHPYEMSIEVAKQSTLGPDGSLAQRVDYFSANESTGMTTFRGNSNYASGGAWSSAPGTYFWQIDAHYLSVVPFESHTYLSPVYTLTIAREVPPPPAELAPPASTPILPLAEAYAAIKEIIKHRSGHAAHHLQDKCRRTSQSQATCNATWLTAVHVSPNALVYSGDFHLDERVAGNYFTFLGIRARIGCSERFGVKHCASRVHWHT